MHETAGQLADDVRVLDVDHDSVAVAHSELILNGTPQTSVLQADAWRPSDILNSRELRALIELSQPVAGLVVALLPFIPDCDQPQRVVAEFGARVVPGSHLAISHLTVDHQNADGSSVRTAAAVTPPAKETARGFFDGWELVPPGLVWVPRGIRTGLTTWGNIPRPHPSTPASAEKSSWCPEPNRSPFQRRFSGEVHSDRDRASSPWSSRSLVQRRRSA